MFLSFKDVIKLIYSHIVSKNILTYQIHIYMYIKKNFQDAKTWKLVELKPVRWRINPYSCFAVGLFMGKF